MSQRTYYSNDRNMREPKVEPKTTLSHRLDHLTTSLTDGINHVGERLPNAMETFGFFFARIGNALSPSRKPRNQEMASDNDISPERYTRYSRSSDRRSV